MKAIKGFDANFRCRGFQFEIGQTYKHTGKVIACEGGFHAIPEDQHPLSVFQYYAPAGSRFCLVEVGGEVARKQDKVAAEILTVGDEIGLRNLTLEAVKWVMDRAKPEGPMATGDNGLATASGNRGAATASGDQGAATASGYQGAATASGGQGAAMSTGYGGSVMGSDGTALFAVERGDEYNIVSVACGIVGQGGIKADTWYRCKDGKLVEVSK